LTPKVVKAFAQADRSHRNQVRDNGGPYLENHIYPIVSVIAKRYWMLPQIEDLVVVAFLHDAIEDDMAFGFSQCKYAFGKRITEYIRPMVKSYKLTGEILTNDEKLTFYRKFIKGIYSANYVTKVVKLEDRLNNTITTESVKNNPGKYTRYILEVEELFLPLAKEISQYYVDAFSKEITRLKFSC
jgi:(p)ppGpp synthase/HD superfamily hydrolase